MATRCKAVPLQTTQAVAYVRVSTEEQATLGASLDAQEARIRAYCALHGLELAHVYRDEGVSASKPLRTRPAGAELVRAIEVGAATHVVAYRLDRLFRDAVDCLQTATQLDDAGIALHLLDMGGQSLNTKSAAGRFFLSVMASAAEMEKRLIGERTSLALQHKKRNGTRLGKPPLGFRVRMPADASDLIPDELEAVRLILRLRAKQEPLRAIVATLRASGLPTKTGRPWTPQVVSDVWGRRAEYTQAMRLL